MYREAFINVTTPSREHPRGGEKGLWPDALIPIGRDRYFGERRSGAPFDVRPCSNQAVWIEILVPDNASAGDYTSEIVVSAAGERTQHVPVRLHVWDFAIPRTSSLPTSFGMGQGVRARHRLTEAGTIRLAQLYAREALRNRVSMWGLWFVNGLPRFQYDPTHPERGAKTTEWDRYDLFYTGPLAGLPEGRATTIEIPPATKLVSQIAAPKPLLRGIAAGATQLAGTCVYRVTAVNAEGETEGSPPQTAYAITEGGIELSWPTVRHPKWSHLNARSYNVYRAMNPMWPEGDVPATYLIGSTTGTRFVDTGLRPANPPKACPNVNTTGDLEAVEIFKAYARHFQRKGWLDRAYLYAQDEPFTSAELEQARRQSLLWRKAFPTGWSLVTNVYSPKLMGAVNLWCVGLNWFDDGEHGRASEVQRRHAAGERVWWCQGSGSRLDPMHRGGAWPSYYIDDTAMSARITGYFTWRYDFDGILYYLTDMAWQKDNDPWVNQFYFRANGDGTLFYPGTPDRVGGKHDIPISSLRFALIRQGLQDYEYLKRLADLGDKPFADRQAARLVQAPDRFANDSAASEVEGVRLEMAKRIEELTRLKR